MVRGSRDKRSRSRSPSIERKRSRRSSRERSKSSRYRRSRSRDRDRDRERHRRSHSRERKRGDGKRFSPSSKSKSKSNRDRSKSKTPNRDKDRRDEESAFDPSSLDKEEEQKRLEAEMQKRRERIERWRAERKKKELEITKKDLKGALANLQLPMKKWTLEDDSDEEEEKQDNKENKDDSEEEEVDPLDAFMQGVQEEVRRVNKLDTKKGDPKPGSTPTTNNINTGVVIMTGVAKKKADKKKGELIEQNQDGLEYSSEEEEEDLNATAAGLANKQKKELAKVDHANVSYPSYRKNFYVEVPEIARMTSEEVDAYKEELEGIRVKGKGCPKPIKTWAQCGVSKKELDILRKQNYEKPTPIQAQAIPAIMSGRDLIGIAKTGSGKTLAFLLPMLRHIMDQPPLEDTDGPILREVKGRRKNTRASLFKEIRKVYLSHSSDRAE